MPVFLLFLAVLLIVVAFNGTYGAFGKELAQDVPGYFTWALAIMAIVALGWIPGLEKPAKLLLGLVVTVILLKNYQTIINGFQSAPSTAASEAQPTNPIQSVDWAGVQQSSGSSSGTSFGGLSGGGSSDTSQYSQYIQYAEIAAAFA